MRRILRYYFRFWYTVFLAALFYFQLDIAQKKPR